MADDKVLRPSLARIGFMQEAKAQGTILGIFIGSMWLSEIVDALIFHGRLDHFGIQPRSIIGLQGILFAPFLHVGFGHLTANTLPLLVLGFFIMLRRKRDLLYVSLISGVIGGLGTWLIGAGNSIHLGASILVFGFLGYLLALGIFERKFWTILGSLVVFFLYGSVLWGALPSDSGISWEGHAFGLIGGIIAARLLADRELKAARAVAAAKVRQIR